MNQSIVAIVPISSEDKELSKRSIPEVQNVSLFDRTLRPLLESDLIERVIVSSDKKWILDECIRSGAESIGKRPASLSRYKVGTAEVVSYELNRIIKTTSFSPKWVLMCHITYPFRTLEFVNNFINTAFENDLDSVFAGYPDRHSSWYTDEQGDMKLVSFGSDYSRYNKKPLIRELGGLISMAHAEVINETKTFYGKKLGVIQINDPLLLLNYYDPLMKGMIDLLPHVE